MAQAGRVRGIRPRRSLESNARIVIAARLEELLSWRRGPAGSVALEDLHDMRIAAKRLRYAIEMFDVCYRDARPVLKELTAMQDALGDIHDLDVLIGLLRGRLRALDAPLEERATEVMAGPGSGAERSNRLRRLVTDEARDRRLGLLGLIGDKRAERERAHAAFSARWDDEALDDFALRVRQATGLIEPPVAAGDSGSTST